MNWAKVPKKKTMVDFGQVIPTTENITNQALSCGFDTFKNNTDHELQIILAVLKAFEFRIERIDEPSIDRFNYTFVANCCHFEFQISTCNSKNLPI